MLTKETVEKVSTLARLKLTEAEIAAFSLQLSAVLENFEKIAQVNTKDVRPLLTPSEITMTLRPDVVEKSVDSEKLLANAPEKSGRLFRVPPVV